MISKSLVKIEPHAAFQPHLLACNQIVRSPTGLVRPQPRRLLRRLLNPCRFITGANTSRSSRYKSFDVTVTAHTMIAADRGRLRNVSGPAPRSRISRSETPLDPAIGWRSRRRERL